MPEPSIYVLLIGVLAQLLFGARQLIQWWSSEKAKAIQSPTLFWIFSLAGSCVFFIYGSLRLDFAIVLGQLLNFYIYCRNLYFKGSWNSAPFILRIVVLLFPVVITGFLMISQPNIIEQVLHNDNISSEMLFVGTAGYLLFTLRFLYQWYVSERLKLSKLPAGFFVISIIGSLLIIWYGIYRADIILIVAYIGGLLVYVRNLMINYKIGV